MVTTKNIGITLVEQAQAQKEVTVNEALKRMDAILNRGAIDKDLTSPPGSPAEGDLYIVAFFFFFFCHRRLGLSG